MTPELAPPLLIPHQREDVSALDRFNVHRCPTRRVFSGTGLELVPRPAPVRHLYHSATANTLCNRRLVWELRCSPLFRLDRGKSKIDLPYNSASQTSNIFNPIFNHNFHRPPPYNNDVLNLIILSFDAKATIRLKPLNGVYERITQPKRYFSWAYM
ncbi:uncharacterized protein TNCV_4070591 [Trichonephila clavipes]|nr:uncharacterized protein TNCV_4070591 [Trichonephila clavipes]